jgi:hypothetical protein
MRAELFVKWLHIRNVIIKTGNLRKKIRTPLHLSGRTLGANNKIRFDLDTLNYQMN